MDIIGIEISARDLNFIYQLLMLLLIGWLNRATFVLNCIVK